MLQQIDYPKTVQFDFSEGRTSSPEYIIERRISDMATMFADQDAAMHAIQNGDRVIYEVLDSPFETSCSDMAMGTSRIFPGLIGDEYHMTRGHLHEATDQPEILICMQGSGYLLLETLEGEFIAQEWEPGTITHIPPMWMHRVVNTGHDILVYLATFHTAAGRLYEPVLEKGFAKIVVEQDGKPMLIDNPQRDNK